MKERGRWRIEFLPIARRELLALRVPTQTRARNAIKMLADESLPADSIPMRGKGMGPHRPQVRHYRIVYRLQPRRICVLVIRIGHRSEVYSEWKDT